MSEITIGKYKIGLNHPPFIVAEMSGNHNGSIERAMKLMEAAKDAGVHAVKLQTYTPDTITLDVREGEFLINDPKSLWKGRNLYDLYQEAHTPWEWHKPLFEYGQKLDLVVFSTPFDESAVDFLETLNTPCYKIGSLEIIDLPLIRKAARTGKPLIISVGAATLAEIGAAVDTARQAGCKEIVLLKCNKVYPAKPIDSNLRTLPHLASCFNTLVGISDHTLSLGVALASVSLGGCLIEKHFTLSRAEGGVDSAFSLEPAEFITLVEESKNGWEALGTIRYGALPAEELELTFRPSLYFVEDIPAGAVVQPHQIRSVRPGRGLPPGEFEHVVGLTLNQPVKKGTPTSWHLFKRV